MRLATVGVAMALTVPVSFCVVAWNHPLAVFAFVGGVALVGGAVVALVRHLLMEWDLRQAQKMPSAAELNYRFHKRMGDLSQL